MSAMAILEEKLKLLKKHLGTWAAWTDIDNDNDNNYWGAIIAMEK